MIELRDYQHRIAEEAAVLLLTKGIAYLAMQVRTGKTITALQTARLFFRHRNYGRRPSVLFLTKKKAISSIAADARRLSPLYDLAVVNYEQLDNLEIWYDLFIIDEAHGLGAYPKPSERTKKLREIVGRKPVIYLSGTPSPESEAQLFHQFWISANSPFRDYTNFYQWAKDFVKVKQRQFGHGMVNDYSHAKREEIMARCGHLFIRYTQEEAGFTEMVQEQIVTVRMKPSTYAFGEKLRKDLVVMNKDGDTVLADTAVKLMQKLHQIYSGTVIVDAPERQTAVFDTTKAEYIRDNFIGQKIAIFYKFIGEGIAIRSVMGSRIVETPEAFAAGGVDTVFISQIQSGREGMNLATADVLIMYNIDFAAVSYFQARARIQSKERDKEARLVWLFSEGGIEGKIYEAVCNKKDYTTRYFKKDFNIQNNQK